MRDDKCFHNAEPRKAGFMKCEGVAHTDSIFKPAFAKSFGKQQARFIARIL
jgi:hypothetical protein